MQIVIDIPDKDYQMTLTKIMLACYGCKITELPKGHGALKDADELAVAIAMIRDKWNDYGNEYESAMFRAYDNSVDEIIDAPTIIEADEEADE